jgi:hypothetical protein
MSKKNVATFNWAGTYCDTQLAALCMIAASRAGWFVVALTSSPGFGKRLDEMLSGKQDPKVSDSSLVVDTDYVIEVLPLQAVDKAVAEPDAFDIRAPSATWTHAFAKVGNLIRSTNGAALWLRRAAWLIKGHLENAEHLIHVEFYESEIMGVSKLMAAAGATCFQMCTLPCFQNTAYGFANHPEALGSEANKLATWVRRARVHRPAMWLLSGMASGVLKQKPPRSVVQQQFLLCFPPALFPDFDAKQQKSYKTWNIGFLLPKVREEKPAVSPSILYISLGSYTKPLLNNKTQLVALFKKHLNGGTAAKIVMQIGDPETRQMFEELGKRENVPLEIEKHVDHAVMVHQSKAVVCTGSYCIQSLCWYYSVPMIVLPYLNEQKMWREITLSYYGADHLKQQDCIGNLVAYYNFITSAEVLEKIKSQPLASPASNDQLLKAFRAALPARTRLSTIHQRSAGQHKMKEIGATRH